MPRKAAAKAANGYQHSAVLPDGLVIKDLAKQEWKVGRPIGQGGFGMIYLAGKNTEHSIDDDAGYVLKMEPISNGPLFCELHFYQRAAKEDMIKKWVASKRGLKQVGVPKFIATGLHEVDGVRNRFIVMERFECDLQKMFEQNGRTFPQATVYKLGIQLLHSLEYMHDHEYVHADIKAANILTGRGSAGKNQVYLVDYGLAYRYFADGKHKEYKEDPKVAHNGTVEFTSIDAHKGVSPARRSDLEILGYCLLQWLCSKLPWEDNLSNKNYVRDKKIQFMSDIPGLMKKCFGKSIPAGIESYLDYVSGIEYNVRPNYDYLHSILNDALKSIGAKADGKLELNISKTDKKTPAKTAVKRPSSTPVRSSPRKSLKRTPTQEPEMLCKSSSKSRHVPKKRGRPGITVGTQTSPGLKGLPKRRK